MALIHIDEVLEAPLHPIARHTALWHHPTIPDRLLALECWYPVISGTESTELAPYELLPGVGFTAQARQDGTCVPGAPVLVFSHGMSGNRLIYSQLCEGLASRGIAVISFDHPGDTMADWIFGLQVDTATNEANRVADLRAVATGITSGQLFAELDLDRRQVHLGGHSYGAFTAFTVAGIDGGLVASVTGLQPHLVPVDRSVLAAISQPVLIVAGELDTSTPVSVDVEPALANLSHETSVHVLAGIGHQGCSDLGLFVELAPSLEGLPEVVLDFLHQMRDGVAGLDEWRPTLRTHLELVTNHVRSNAEGHA